MYQQLSAKVERVSYNAAKKKTMALYKSCNDKSAWDIEKVEKYQKCTDQISKSNHRIQENIDYIKMFSVNNNDDISIHNNLGRILGDQRLGRVSIVDEFLV